MRHLPFRTLESSLPISSFNPHVMLIPDMKRVVVTGIGAVSPLGNSFRDSWQAAKAGLSGIGQITKFDTSEMKWKDAGQAGMTCSGRAVMSL
jgi:hypothetical protein